MTQFTFSHIFKRYSEAHNLNQKIQVSKLFPTDPTSVCHTGLSVTHERDLSARI